MAMKLYTKKGDDGKTALFGCDQRMLKNAPAMEALGDLDELVSLLGVCRAKAKNNKRIASAVMRAQENLFLIMARIGGAKKNLDKNAVSKMEEEIDSIARELPKIKGFIIPGGSKLAAYLDYARAVARRCERRCVALKDKHKLPPDAIKYLNRLSSLLFALARLANKRAKARERAPRY